MDIACLCVHVRACMDIACLCGCACACGCCLLIYENEILCLSYRTPAPHGKINEQVLHHSSQVSGNGRISPRTNSGSDVTEFKSEVEGTEWDNHVMPSETMGFVNNNNDTLKPSTQHEIVNNTREHLNMEPQLMPVNSDTTRPENEENHFEENEDEFD